MARVRPWLEQGTTVTSSDYALLDPRICGYYRSAIYLISTNSELISEQSDTECFNTLNSSHNTSSISPVSFSDSGYSSIANDTNLSEHIVNNINEDDLINISIDFQTNIQKRNDKDLESTPNPKSKQNAHTHVTMDEGFKTLKSL